MVCKASVASEQMTESMMPNALPAPYIIAQIKESVNSEDEVSDGFHR